MFCYFETHFAFIEQKAMLPVTNSGYTKSNLQHKTTYRDKPLKLLLLTGLLVGTLDIIAACTDYYIATGKGPEGVLRYVASGVFGKQAFSGGTAMALWGLLFHFIIAYSFTFFFYWLYPRFKFMREQKVLSAILFGIFMWVITTKIVLPLRNTPPAAPFVWWKAVKAISILIVMISLPLTLIIGNRYKKNYFRINTENLKISAV